MLADQTDIEDVLTKVATYQTAKTAADASQAVANLASSLETAARSHWDTAVANGETDEEKLTSLLNDLLDAALDAAAKQEAAQTASTTAYTASNAVNNKIYAILHPDP